MGTQQWMVWEREKEREREREKERGSNVEDVNSLQKLRKHCSKYLTELYVVLYNIIEMYIIILYISFHVFKAGYPRLGALMLVFMFVWFHLFGLMAWVSLSLSLSLSLSPYTPFPCRPQKIS